MNAKEQTYYTRFTPAGLHRSVLGITEEPRPHEAHEMVEKARIDKQHAYGRDLFDSEVRALEFDAERRTTIIHHELHLAGEEVAARMVAAANLVLEVKPNGDRVLTPRDYRPAVFDTYRLA